VTAAAKIVDSAKLNQQAVIATDYFSGIYWSKRCSHLGLGGGQSGLPRNQKRTTLDTLVPNLMRNLRDNTAKVKQIVGGNVEIPGENKNNSRKIWETQVRDDE
jgi:hypothetical protein